MTTIAQIEIGQRFKLQRDPQGCEYVKIAGDDANASEVATGSVQAFGSSTKVLLPPYAPVEERKQMAVWIDGAAQPYQATPFLARQLADLRQEYGNPSEVIKAALRTWLLNLTRAKAFGDLPVKANLSDMQALRELTGLRPQEVIELAVYDLWKGYKGL